MTNFKSRQASAKKVIQLQNEILSLKNKLSSTKVAEPEPCEDCQELRQQIDSILKEKNEEKALLQEEVAALKADLKKVRSENTRLKNKLKDLESEDS